MKRLLRIYILLLFVFFIFSACTKTNQAVIDIFTNNQEYFDSAVEQVLNSKDYELSEELKNVSIIDISEDYNSISFVSNADFFLYSGYLYSIDGEPKLSAEVGTGDALSTEEFREVKDGVYMKGKKNNGTSWYSIQRINEHWFYYEYALA